MSSSLLDGVLALALALGGVLALSLSQAPEGGRDPDALAYALTLGFALPLVVRRRWPAGVLCLHLVLIPLYVGRGYPSALVDFAAPTLAFYTVAERGPRRVSLPAAAALAMVASLSFALAPGDAGSSTPIFTTFAIVAGVWLLGDSVRQRRAYADQLEVQTRELEAARDDLAEQAVLQERMRIARDLHDVVAHHMSAIAVQAAVARRTLGINLEAAERAYEHIESLSRSALTEMRQMLGVLQLAGEAGASLAPAPRMSDLHRLLTQTRDSGVTLRETWEGTPVELSPAAEVTAYRIVQEALTNVIKHASAARATVRLIYGEKALRIEVCNEGPAAVSPSGTAGRGIKGMRERLVTVGGTLEAGPDASDGFRVVATIPYERPA